MSKERVPMQEPLKINRVLERFEKNERLTDKAIIKFIEQKRVGGERLPGRTKRWKTENNIYRYQLQEKTINDGDITFAFSYDSLKEDKKNRTSIVLFWKQDDTVFNYKIYDYEEWGKNDIEGKKNGRMTIVVNKSTEWNDDDKITID